MKPEHKIIALVQPKLSKTEKFNFKTEGNRVCRVMIPIVHC